MFNMLPKLSTARGSAPPHVGKRKITLEKERQVLTNKTIKALQIQRKYRRKLSITYICSLLDLLQLFDCFHWMQKSWS